MMRNLQKQYESPGISDELVRRVERAAGTSWKNFGRKITFYLPGMFTLYGEKGRYPAVSVTGSECELQCKHCRGKLLKPMPPARTAEELLSLAKQWKRDGIEGMLLSGGSTKDGYVPLFPLLPAVPKLKEMGFYVSAHTGFATKELAEAISHSQIDQVLLDIVGDDKTAKNILNLDNGIVKVKTALDALFSYNLNVIPHIIIGLGGKIIGERNALKILKDYPIEFLSYVVLMPAVSIGRDVAPIPIEQAVDIIVSGREMFPNIVQSLGCARPRGEYRYELEKWALRAGINRMALWSESAIEEAENLGLQIEKRYTCCSVQNSSPLEQDKSLMSKI